MLPTVCALGCKALAASPTALIAYDLEAIDEPAAPATLPLNPAAIEPVAPDTIDVIAPAVCEIPEI